jgi:hypothetical protein
VVLILLLTSCTGKKKPYSIIEFSGKGDLINYSKSFGMIGHKADSVNPTALLAGKNDLISYGDYLLYYKETSQNKFQFKTINNTVYINGKLTSINIPGNNDMIPWFKQMESTDISALNFLQFKSNVPEDYFPYLTDLAKLKPDIGLAFDGELPNSDRLLKIFNPQIIYGLNLSPDNFKMLSGLTNLELLFVFLTDSLNTISLPAIPSLKQLILFATDVTIGNDFLINNKQIEQLTINVYKRFDMSVINPLTNLKELTILANDTLENTDLLKSHKNLEVLSIASNEFMDYSILNDLTHIRWISFYPTVNQTEFNSFIKFHPDLEVVEIIDNKTINSLKPLSELKKLYGLVISDTVADFTTIKSLKNLQYLSLPRKFLNDSIKKAELQKMLPGCILAANDKQGVCLGSGWLLLIIPLILLFRVFSYRKSHPVSG